MKYDPTQIKSKSPRQRDYINYIEYFRGVAILIIISGHTYGIAWTHYVDQSPLNSRTWLNFIPSLITGGTFYFVFISGFLYRHIYFDSISYSKFMWKKFLYVGLPYLLISIPVSLYWMTFKGFKVVIAADGGFSAENKFLDMVSLLTTGWGVTGYWYIPFIFIVFFSSPLIDRFIRLDRGGKFIVFSVSLLLSFWALRPSENLNPIHSTLYFLNPYLFGIIFYENREKLEVILRKRSVILVIAIMMVLVALAQATIMNYNGNLERGPGDGWGLKGLDLMLIQKYLGTLCACGLLAVYGDRCARSLRFIAKYSFGLFFMHGLVIAVLTEMPPSLSPHSRIPLVDLALYTIVTIGLSLLAAVTLKHVSGRYSRYVVGC